MNASRTFVQAQQLHQAGRFHEAEALYRQVLALQPEHAGAWHFLGILAYQAGRNELAIELIGRALAFNPNDAAARANLGEAYRIAGCMEEAVATMEQAAKARCRHPELYNNLGLALAETGRIDEAVENYRRALQLRPAYAAACNNLGVALLGRGELTEAIAILRQAVQAQPDFTAAHSNLIIAALYHPDFDRPALHAECRRWDEQHARPFRSAGKLHRNVPDPARKLKVGYVSPDFRNTVVGRNLAPLFREHDRGQVEIWCYSQVGKPDAFTEEFRRAAAQWRDVAEMGDVELAEVILRDEVDILVDLAVQTAGNRLPVFARRPAPVQVSFAAYPETTGLEAIPYRMSDRYLEDLGHAATEEVLLLESFWCFDPCGAAIEVNALPAARDGRVTFGCLNNFCKVNEHVLRLWARILGEVPGSRLVLLSPEGSHRAKALQILENAGVEGARVEFIAPCLRQAYLELYQRLDIVLDPFPYCGHSTSLDALWMGVPVVTLTGERAVSRGGLSQLSNLGLEELVAFSEEDYAAIATRLAGDLARLAELRATLRGRMQASVLMDGRRFAGNIETAYRSMWRRWCAGQQS